MPAARIPVKEVLLSAWLAVAALFLSPIVIGLAQLRSLRRNAFPWPAGQSLAGAHVEVLLHEEVRSPITCGVLRSAIIFPPDVRTWDEADVTRAIVHELEHVHRFDCLTQCLARAVCAVYWFHPLMWIAWRRLTLEAERSCDDAVLAHSEATAYADQLVDLAQRLSTGASAPVLAMANRADLARRVNSVLDGTGGEAGQGSLRLSPRAVPPPSSCSRFRRSGWSRSRRHSLSHRLRKFRSLPYSLRKRLRKLRGPPLPPRPPPSS